MNKNNYTITNENLSEYKMIYAERVGAYEPENYLLMEKFKNWLVLKELITDESIILGIAMDDVSTTPPDRCRYRVCLLGNISSDTDWVKTGCLNAGKYAVIKLPHTAEDVGYIWQTGFDIISSSGYKLDFTRPVIERYKKALVDKGFCEMLFPVL